MITMEVNGISWVGDIYHKFEAMCLEVEEVVCEDTVKYVENQVQTVGATVKKFYSDVIQDLLPHSVEHIELPSADLLLNQSGDFGVCKTPEASINVSMCREITDNHDELCDQISTASCPDSVEDMGDDMRLRETFCDGAVLSTVSVAVTSIENPTDMILLVEPCVTKETELRSSYSVDGPGGVSAESNGTCNNSGGISLEELNASGDALNEDNGSSRRGGSAEWNLDVIDNSGSVEFGIDTINPIEHSKLEETCILVDGDQLRLHPSREDKPRSYKKKIRNAFSSISSARKHEYQQLAVQYENMKTGSNHKVVESMTPNLTGDASANNIPAYDLCESEWELL